MNGFSRSIMVNVLSVAFDNYFDMQPLCIEFGVLFQIVVCIPSFHFLCLTWLILCDSGLSCVSSSIVFIQL